MCSKFRNRHPFLRVIVVCCIYGCCLDKENIMSVRRKERFSNFCDFWSISVLKDVVNEYPQLLKFVQTVDRWYIYATIMVENQSQLWTPFEQKRITGSGASLTSLASPRSPACWTMPIYGEEEWLKGNGSATKRLYEIWRREATRYNRMEKLLSGK